MMNIYRCIDSKGRIEFRAGQKEAVLTKHYDNQRLEFVKVEMIKHNVSYREVFNHKLPILICQ